jgi:hypothetical protein
MRSTSFYRVNAWERRTRISVVGGGRSVAAGVAYQRKVPNAKSTRQPEKNAETGAGKRSLESLRQDVNNSETRDYAPTAVRSMIRVGRAVVYVVRNETRVGGNYED